MLATIGIRMARATSLSRVASNRLIAEDATIAVIKLTPNHMARRGAVLLIDENVSSVSLRPAIASNEWSASSTITSTTSSIVIRPKSLL